MAEIVGVSERSLRDNSSPLSVKPFAAIFAATSLHSASATTSIPLRMVTASALLSRVKSPSSGLHIRMPRDSG